MNIKKYIKRLGEVIQLNSGFVRFLGKRNTAYFVGLSILASLFNSVNYIALIPLVSVVVDGSKLEDNSMLSSFTRFIPVEAISIYSIAAVIIVAFILKFCLNILFSHLAGYFAENYMFELRQKMMKTMADEYYQSGIHTPSQILHFNNMVTRVGSFNWASLSMLSKAISALFLFTSLFLVEFKLAAFSVLFVVFWASILMPVFKFTRKIAAEYSSALQRVQTFLKDEIEAKEIIQIFNLVSSRDLKLEILKKDAVRGNALLSDIRAVVLNLQEFIVVVVGVVLLCVAYHHHLEIGYLIAYGYVFSKFINTLNDCSTSLNNALEVMPPVEEILGYVKSDSAPVESSTLVDNRIEELTYKNVHFAWADQLLFEMNELNLKVGDRVVITGKNGVGKSTLLRVLAGLIHSQGEMRINRGAFQPLDQVRRLHPKFSYIPQNGVVFAGSLVENIVLNSGKSIEDIRNLANRISIDLAEYFPNWQTFQVQEDGNNLSGGEMQIVSIFRALIRDHDVLFIDEFSNHLSDRVIKNVDRYLSTLDRQIVVCVSHSHFEFPNRTLQVQDRRVSSIV